MSLDVPTKDFVAPTIAKNPKDQAIFRFAGLMEAVDPDYELGGEENICLTVSSEHEVSCECRAATDNEIR